MHPDRVAAFLGFAILLFFFSSPALSADPAPLSADGQWHLIFQDEFEAERLDGGKWTTCYWWNKDGCTNLGNRELQWYRPENVSLSDGALHLTARRQKVTGIEGRKFRYTSGMVTTGRDYAELPRPSRVRFRYGHVEVRAKAPAGKGFWSAIWLLPETRESRPEIDIMEVLGDSGTSLRMHYHYTDGNGKEQDPGKTATVADLTRDWHVYGLTWDKDKLVWYLDGKEVWRWTDAASIAGEDMYLLLNLAVGGEWPGPPSKRTKFPSSYLIDYVRIWQRSEK
ncbi:glycoside hydrolase family 16 protein [Shinella zoogloeoides]